MKSLIFGYGVTGQSFERYLQKKGEDDPIFQKIYKVLSNFLIALNLKILQKIYKYFDLAELPVIKHSILNIMKLMLIFFFYH